MGMALLTACESDRDDNPTIDLSKQQAPIILNSPTFANSMGSDMSALMEVCTTYVTVAGKP